MIRRILIVALAFGLVFGLSQAPLAEAASETLKVGVITPMSGPGAPWGIALFRGVEMAAEDINAAGGIKVGGKSYKVELIPGDDKYSGKGGVDAAMKLVNQDQVKFIIGSISSVSVLAFQAITEPAKILLMTNTYAKKVTGPDKPYSFRINMTSHEINIVQYKWLRDNKPNVKKLAVIAPNDATGWAITEDAKTAAKLAGFEVVAAEFYERGTKDFYPILTKILAKKPDWIDTGGSPPGALGLILKQSREMGYKGGAGMSSGVNPATLVKIAGKEYVEGYMVATMPYDGPLATEQESQNVKKYLKKYGPPYNPIATFFYPALKIMQQGIEQADSLDTTKVMKKMSEPDFKFDVFGKRAWWTGKDYYGIDRQIVIDVAISFVKDGKTETVERIPAAQVDKLVK